MGVRNNLRTDLRLRNLTIYAQWASVLAAMLLYLLAIPELFVYFNYLFALSSSYRDVYLKWILLDTLYVGAMNFLFPLAPLALDLPQYIRRKPFLYASTVSWFALPLCLFPQLYRIAMKHPIVIFITVYLFTGAFMLLPILIRNPLWLGTRFGVNILYCGQLVFSIYIDRFMLIRAVKHGWLIRCELWVHCITAGLFGIAALLCGTAWTMRHTWVSSRLLGGTGIEPMVLMLPGRGPLYQSVGDEAREGAIRLV